MKINKFLPLLTFLIAVLIPSSSHPLAYAEAPRNLRKVPWVDYGIKKDFQIEELMKLKKLNEVEALLLVQTDKVNDEELSEEKREQIKALTATFVKWSYETFEDPTLKNLAKVEGIVEEKEIDFQSAAIFYILKEYESDAKEAELTKKVHDLIQAIDKVVKS